MDKSPFDDLTSKLGKAVPDSLRTAQEDLAKTLRAGLQGTMHRLDLVSREEFDVQSAVLARTREKLELLEARVKLLEEKLGMTSTQQRAPDEGS